MLNEIKKGIARSVYFPFMVRTGISRLLEGFSSNRRLILNFHGVVSQADPAVSVNQMGVKQFSEIAEFLKKNYRVLSLDENIREFSEGKTNKKTAITITFDDGYENNFTQATPVLAALDLPFTVFVTTAHVNTETPLWFDLLDFLRGKIEFNGKNDIQNLLSKTGSVPPAGVNNYSELKRFLKTKNQEDRTKTINEICFFLNSENPHKSISPEFWRIISPGQIQEMLKISRGTIGSHTQNHSNLDILTEEEARKEISGSKIFLENIIQGTVDSLAFPDGAYNNQIKKIAFQAGYKHLFSVNKREASDDPGKGIFPRLSISNTTIMESVIYSFGKGLKERGF